MAGWPPDPEEVRAHDEEADKARKEKGLNYTDKPEDDDPTPEEPSK